MSTHDENPTPTPFEKKSELLSLKKRCSSIEDQDDSNETDYKRIKRDQVQEDTTETIENNNILIDHQQQEEVLQEKAQQQMINEDDPVVTGSLSITNHLYDNDEDYNEESDQDWVSGNGEASDDSDSDASLLDQLQHPVFQVGGSGDNGDSLDDVDVDGIDEESQYQLSWTPYTEEEMEVLRDQVKEKGLMKFIDQYIVQESVPVPKMLEAFGIYMHPKAAILASDIELLPILRSVVTRYLRKRARLPNVNTLTDVTSLLSTSSNIMIVTGAGVSVSCGIPDFRSETGIYARLQEYQLDDPQQMFDIEYFRESPEIFYSFAKELYPAKYEPSPSHLFVKMMEEKKKLLRNYTQNIDTLEHKADIKRVVNCHGSFATASCVTCGHRVDGKEIEEYIMAQQIPPCPKCKENKQEQLAQQQQPKKKTAGGNSDDEDDDDDQPTKGVSIMKPDITFFGERLPAEFDNLLAVDTEQVDLLIVMGSSLKVSPVSEIMSQIPHSVPQILINRTPITHMTFDIQLLGNSDVIVPELCRMLKWDLKHPKLPGGSALSEESLELSRHGDGDVVEWVDPDTKQIMKEHKIYKYWRDGLYTFPGAVLDPKYANAQRCDERGSLGSDNSDDDSSDVSSTSNNEETTTSNVEKDDNNTTVITD